MADVYFGYDAQNVYLGMVATDPYWTPAPAASGNIWQGCGIQLMIWNSRATNSNSEYGFALNANGRTHNQWSVASGATNIGGGFSNYNVRRVGDSDTFIYTIAIPLSSFRAAAATNPLAEGQELWFTICYNFPNNSGNISYAFDMGFHIKNLNEARSLRLGQIGRAHV